MTRPRAYSDPTSPPLISPSHLPLTESSLSRLPLGPHVWPFNTAHSYSGRVTPSTTSVSDGEDEKEEVEEGLGMSITEEQVRDWVGKGKSREGVGLAGSLPPEILVSVRQCDLQEQAIAD